MRRLLAAIIAATAAAQLWLAWRYYGFLTGDDVEVLSEAFRCGRVMSRWIACLRIRNPGEESAGGLGARLQLAASDEDM